MTCCHFGLSGNSPFEPLRSLRGRTTVLASNSCLLLLCASRCAWHLPSCKTSLRRVVSPQDKAWQALPAIAIASCRKSTLWALRV